jgi:hypothetical protein
VTSPRRTASKTDRRLSGFPSQARKDQKISPVLLSVCTPPFSGKAKVASADATQTNEKGNAMKNLIALENRKFELGRIVSTPGALEACSQDYLLECLTRHAGGDWGLVCKEDAAENELSLKQGFRLLSAYPIDPAKPSKGFGDNTLWIITEADRSATTFLLPSEY